MISRVHKANTLLNIFYYKRKNRSEYFTKRYLSDNASYTAEFAYSCIRGSSKVTPFTTVGATYFSSTLTSPPKTISPRDKIRVHPNNHNDDDNGLYPWFPTGNLLNASRGPQR